MAPMPFTARTPRKATLASTSPCVSATPNGACATSRRSSTSRTRTGSRAFRHIPCRPTTWRSFGGESDGGAPRSLRGDQPLRAELLDGGGGEYLHEIFPFVGVGRLAHAGE